jgi:hypothetical protein
VEDSIYFSLCPLFTSAKITYTHMAKRANESKEENEKVVKNCPSRLEKYINLFDVSSI